MMLLDTKVVKSQQQRTSRYYNKTNYNNNPPGKAQPPRENSQFKRNNQEGKKPESQARAISNKLSAEDKDYCRKHDLCFYCKDENDRHKIQECPVLAKNSGQKQAQTQSSGRTIEQIAQSKKARGSTKTTKGRSRSATGV